MDGMDLHSYMAKSMCPICGQTGTQQTHSFVGESRSFGPCVFHAKLIASIWAIHGTRHARSKGSHYFLGWGNGYDGGWMDGWDGHMVYGAQ